MVLKFRLDHKFKHPGMMTEQAADGSVKQTPVTLDTLKFYPVDAKEFVRPEEGSGPDRVGHENFLYASGGILEVVLIEGTDLDAYAVGQVYNLTMEIESNAGSTTK
jgi:hypothetical protein